MMPRPYRYFHCSEFPIPDQVGDEVQTVQQLSLGGENHEAVTKFRYEGEADEPSFERYLITHQREVNVNLIIQQEKVRRAIAIEEFNGYYKRSGGYWLLMADRRTSRSAWERMAKRPEPIRATESGIDLNGIDQNLGMVTGAYFKELDIRDVRGAALFGTDQVMESDEAKYYLEQGVVSAVYMHVAQESGLGSTVMVTKDRLVLVLSTLQEADDLRLAAELNAWFEEAGLVTD